MQRLPISTASPAYYNAQPAAPKQNVKSEMLVQQNGTTLPTVDSSPASLSDVQLDAFVASLEGNIDVFVNRIRSDVQRGRPIHVDTTVQTLFQTITAQHGQLAAYTNQQDEARIDYEGLQDQLTNLREAREALESLRNEHRERMRAQAEAESRIRQAQMAEKLGALRDQKRQLLDVQRQMALQRLHDEELQLQMKRDSRRYGVAPAMPPPPPQGASPYYNVYPGAPMTASGMAQPYYVPTYNPYADSYSAPQGQLQQQRPHMTQPPPAPSADLGQQATAMSNAAPGWAPQQSTNMMPPTGNGQYSQPAGPPGVGQMPPPPPAPQTMPPVAAQPPYGYAVSAPPASFPVGQQAGGAYPPPQQPPTPVVAATSVQPPPAAPVTVEEEPLIIFD